MIGPSPGLARLQARWHTASCTITRDDPDAEPVLDPNTGSYTTPDPVTVYTGDCLITPEGGDQVQDFGEQPVPLRRYTVSLPDMTTAVWVDDRITVTASRDPLLVDRSLVVLDVPKSELGTVRRLRAEEVLD